MWVSVASSFCHEWKALGPWAPCGRADPVCPLSVPSLPPHREPHRHSPAAARLGERQRPGTRPPVVSAERQSPGRGGAGEGGGGWDPSHPVPPVSGKWVRLPGHPLRQRSQPHGTGRQAGSDSGGPGGGAAERQVWPQEASRDAGRFGAVFLRSDTCKFAKLGRLFNRFCFSE